MCIAKGIKKNEYRVGLAPSGVYAVVEQGHTVLVEKDVCLVSVFVFFFKQKTAYEIGLGIPAEPLFRSPTECQQSLNETQKEIAGIQSATSRQNTKDQVDRKSVV